MNKHIPVGITNQSLSRIKTKPISYLYKILFLVILVLVVYTYQFRIQKKPLNPQYRHFHCLNGSYSFGHSSMVVLASTKRRISDGAAFILG